MVNITKRIPHLKEPYVLSLDKILGNFSLEQFSGSSQPGFFGTNGSPNLSVTGGIMIFTGNGTWDSVMRNETSISEVESVSFVFKKNNNNGQTNALIHTGNYGQAN